MLFLPSSHRKAWKASSQADLLERKRLTVCSQEWEEEIEDSSETEAQKSRVAQGAIACIPEPDILGRDLRARLSGEVKTF